jgi:hypothetical protein
MKHLKIYFAILFFSFLGGANIELMAQSNKIVGGETLKAYSNVNKRDYTIVSKNDNYSFRVYDDFIGVFKGNTEDKVWTKKFSTSISYIRVLTNGNCAIYDKDDKVIWETGTTGRGGDGTHLQIQNDGNLVLYNGTWYGGDGDALWATGTCDGVLNGCGSEGVR